MIFPLCSNVAKLRNPFWKFVFFSGLGWVCDLASYSLLVLAFGVPAGNANFVSSFVGVTFVWFTSLKVVFGKIGAAQGRFLSAYWGYQLASILTYSQILRWLVSILDALIPSPSFVIGSAILGKVLVTPLNLVTNYLFMRFLSRFMQAATTGES